MHTPTLLYGTAWKEAQTRGLVAEALRAGYRGIDTANQRKHYHEAAVGEGIADAGVPRAELFLQTKFTFQEGQDARLPYDPKAPIADQVVQSFASSQEHLRTDVIDSYVLHGPSRRFGLGDEDWAAWRAMEGIHASGRARALGVSNVSVDQLAALLEGAKVAPAFVQNRCYAKLGWDRRVRQLCTDRGIRYQGFSLLTANPQVVDGPVVGKIARRVARTPQQVVFRAAIDLGILPLTGTTDPRHMREDLALDFTLTPAELKAIDSEQ